MSDVAKVCGLAWKDTTSYSRGDPREPSCWTACVGVFKITVLSSHLYYPGKWVGHCDPFFDTKPLDATTRDEAMAKAIALLRVPIVQAYQQLIKLGKPAKRPSDG